MLIPPRPLVCFVDSNTAAKGALVPWEFACDLTLIKLSLEVLESGALELSRINGLDRLEVLPILVSIEFTLKDLMWVVPFATSRPDDPLI